MPPAGKIEKLIDLIKTAAGYKLVIEIKSNLKDQLKISMNSMINIRNKNSENEIQKALWVLSSIALSRINRDTKLT